MAFSPVFLLFFPSDKLEIPLAGGRMKNSPMVFFFLIIIIFNYFFEWGLNERKKRSSYFK